MNTEQSPNKQSPTFINKDTPVLVTGATGYVAGQLIKLLLVQGTQVHAAVRDPSKVSKLKFLNQLADTLPGSITYFKADLLDSGSYLEAMQGCELVYHTASPFSLNIQDPQRDLIDPALKARKMSSSQPTSAQALSAWYSPAQLPPSWLITPISLTPKATTSLKPTGTSAPP